MTIRAGQPWGAPGSLAAGAPVVDSDAAAAAVLQARLDAMDRASGTDLAEGALGEVGVLGGDLHRTLGAPRRSETELRAGVGTRFPIDVGVVELDGSLRVFVAHLVAFPRRRLRWWSDRTVTVLNGSHVGPYDLGPRSHPNDGRLDLTDGSLPLGQRRSGRRRSLTGTHVPHPNLTTRRVREVTVEAAPRPRLHVWLDGQAAGSHRSMHIRCLADAAVVVV